MTNTKTLSAIVVVLSICLLGASKQHYGNVQATIDNVHDGDTVRVNITGWHPVVGHKVSVRVYGVDCRELKSGATTAKEQVTKWLPVGTKIWLLDIRRDKYFRLLADIGFNCGNFELPSTCSRLSDELITNKLAVPYFGEKKQIFPDEIK